MGAALCGYENKDHDTTFPLSAEFPGVATSLKLYYIHRLLDESNPELQMLFLNSRHRAT